MTLKEKKYLLCITLSLLLLLFGLPRIEAAKQPDPLSS